MYFITKKLNQIVSNDKNNLLSQIFSKRSVEQIPETKI